MRARSTPVLSGRVQSQLALCAAAMAGTAGVASTAQAVIVTTFQNTVIPVPATLAGVYLNFETGATGTASFAGWDFNPYQRSATPSPGIGFYWNQTPASTHGGVSTGVGSSVYLDMAATGGVSGPTSNFTAAIPGTDPQFRTTGIHRLGFKFVNAAAAVNFGYLTIQTTAGTGTGSGFPATILGWVFENSGAAINVPAVPEPSSAALLAMVAGAAGLRGWRRNRSA